MIIQAKTNFDEIGDNHKDNYENAYFEARKRLAKQIAEHILDNGLMPTREEFNIDENQWELIGYIEVKERK